MLNLIEGEEATREQLVEIVAKADKVLAGLLAESDAAPQVILREEDFEVRGWGTETSAEALAVTAEWEWTGRTGTHTAAVTVIQTIRGGRDGGEGWAEAAQYVSKGLLTADEARTLAALALAGLLPKLAGWSEL